MDVDFLLMFQSTSETKLLIRLASISIRSTRYTYVQCKSVTWIAWSVKLHSSLYQMNRNFELKIRITYYIQNRILNIRVFLPSISSVILVKKIFLMWHVYFYFLSGLVGEMRFRDRLGYTNMRFISFFFFFLLYSHRVVSNTGNGMISDEEIIPTILIFFILNHRHVSSSQSHNEIFPFTTLHEVCMYIDRVYGPICSLNVSLRKRRVLQ